MDKVSMILYHEGKEHGVDLLLDIEDDDKIRDHIESLALVLWRKLMMLRHGENYFD